MKHLLNTLCTASTLKLLIGEDIGFDFPLKFPKEKEDKRKMKLRLPATLGDIMLATPHHCKQSFDPRFDRKHKIQLAIENLQANGFTKSQVYKLLHNKSAVRTNSIKGPLLFLSNFITDEYKAEIIAKLREVSHDVNGFRRNGDLF